MTRICGLAPLLAIILLLGACGDTTATVEGESEATLTPPAAPSSPPPPADQAFPVTVSADNGDVTIASKPTAIVSLSPSITEMLYAIDAGSQVTAVDGSSNYPPGAPITDLSGFRPNVEAIAALDPDLVFLARDRDDVVATLESVGITVVLLEAAGDVEDVFTQVRTVGAATGNTAAANALADDLDTTIDELTASVPERAEPVTYFYELSDEYHSATSGTFIGSVMGHAGLENIADSADPAAGDYPQLTAEYVLDADPDVIVIAHVEADSDPAVAEQQLAERPGWADLTAVTTGQVVVLDSDIASRWGPRVVDLLRVMVEATAGID
ncbi:MAG: ABC transporter substrate-binding protein [Acidimicrobiales bacterium]